ncbi:hypothetical protein GGS23DRAFT_381340 [Durotheca rogersii]|uniref:uncharacterized protein n=1 Tax=Durotheca rogersii TaxID=419775 RepID=UPI00221F96B9|nr:uncharacterized protein GGS23DRAFT_381340 [Durotheca rogersii]KAI5866318.1 hypothetical protein GGS23DRAFT_381340 [Durotheca rogersii]
MPLIEGRKMACEPCIRGHRSTKCTHSDRVMIPVRKPGRPLSSCPHPPGRTCSCSPVTAAIPRKTQCGCSRPGKANSAGAAVKTEPSGSPPLSPAKNVTFRVQKSSASGLAQRRTLDYSAALERMDSNSLNYVGAPNTASATTGGIAGGPTDQIGVASSSDFMSSISNGIHQSASFVPSSYSYQSTLPSLNTGLVPLFPLSGSMVNVGNGVSGQSSVGSDTPSSPYHTPSSSPTESLSQEPSVEVAGSCCCSPPEPSYPQVQTQAHTQLRHQPQIRPQGPMNAMVYRPQDPAATGAMMAPYPPPLALNQQIFSPSHMQPPATYAQPNSYGTPHHPLQYEQWQQTMTNYLQSAMQMSYGNSPQIPSQTDLNGIVGNPYTNHDCTCGTACQCVGCPAHPFNQATREHVRSAFMYQYSSFGNMIDAGNPMPDPPLAASAASGTSPPAAPSPPDKEPTNTEDQDRSPGEYFFVQYDLETSNQCLCGDNCSCIECMVHNEPPAITPT